MPAECFLLDGTEVPLTMCPDCGAAPFEPFLRGEVQRSKRTLFSWPPFKVRPYCALICRACKNIVGHEMPYVLSSMEKSELLREAGFGERLIAEVAALDQVKQRETFDPNAVRWLLDAVAEEYKISPDLDALEVEVLRAAAVVRASEFKPTQEPKPILGLWK